MATLKEEQEQLKSKIVESPEELKNYKELMKETVKKLKKSKVRSFSLPPREEILNLKVHLTELPLS